MNIKKEFERWLVNATADADVAAELKMLDDTKIEDALEMLGKKSILFSTTNPCNRYIRLQNVQTNNNLRDLYLRSLTLGGQKEEMYEETDSVAIGRAFRRAGKAVEAHVES